MNELTLEKITSGIYVDTTSRTLRYYAVSVTRAEDNGLVFRYAAELSSMPHSADWVFVDSRGYSAQSSKGYTLICGSSPTLKVVGLCTFEKSLRPVKPFEVNLIHRCQFEEGKTHTNSNVLTAAAAVKYLSLEAESLHPPATFVLEGQSDTTSCYKFISWQSFLFVSLDSLEIEEEHRIDIINAVSIRAAEIEDNLYLSYFNLEWSKENIHVDVLETCQAKIDGNDSDAEAYGIIREAARHRLIRIRNNTQED